jgi:DNA-binding response OmpR family regulator
MQELILVIEDEPDMAESIVRALEHGGFRAITAADGREGLDRVRSERPVLVLLDLMLPQIDGMDVCSKIREHSEVPIVMLTGLKAENDRVEGLTRGADDYITKPFRARELCARLAAVLRRSRHWSDDEDHGIQVGELRVNEAAREVTLRGEPVELTPREFDLLAYLVRNAGSVVPRERILERIWGEDQYIDPRTLDVHIRWLREKLEQDPSNPACLLTVRGVGYKLTPGE